MHRTPLLLLMIPVVACVPIARSTAEFRQQVSDGAVRGSMKEDRSIDRPFQKVLADVRANADRCFNVVTEHSRPRDLGYGASVLRIVYRSSTTTTGPAAAEMTVRMLVPTGDVPEGGYYAVLGDLEAVAPATTRVTLYGPDASSWSDALDAVFTWASGKARSCPKLP